ncbi:MAG: hypothetical protein ACI89U_002689 [Gammaproteobacteria bacterium]|jgi:hypothetical protein
MNDPKLLRWPMLRNGIIFQLKLGLDAGRDLLLSPISILCLIVDLIRGETTKKSYFRRLMALGLKTDHWINLFGSHTPPVDSDAPPDSNVDYLFAKVERVFKEQHSKGGLTTHAKSSINRYRGNFTDKDIKRTDEHNDSRHAENLDNKDK